MANEHLQGPKTQAAIRRIGSVMAEHIAPLFIREALVTVIVRFPTNDEADFFMSSEGETLAELRRLLDRCEAREVLQHDTEVPQSISGEKR